MRQVGSLRGLAGAALLLIATPASAGEVCEAPPSGGPVSLIILKGPRQVHELASALARGVPVAARDAATVAFQDGRVITSDAEGASRLLNRLGWGGRPISVVASFAPPRAMSARAPG